MPELDESPAPSRFYPVPEKMAREIENQFTYHRPEADQLPRYSEIRDFAKDFALIIVRLTPPSREQALALTKLEEAVMHANSAIAREPRKALPDVNERTIPAMRETTEGRDAQLQALADENAVKPLTPATDLAPHRPEMAKLLVVSVDAGTSAEGHVLFAEAMATARDMLSRYQPGAVELKLGSSKARVHVTMPPTPRPEKQPGKDRP